MADPDDKTNTTGGKPGSEPYPRVLYTPAVDNDALTDIEQYRLTELSESNVPPAEGAGVFCTPRPQPLARYISRDDETVISNPAGSYICLRGDNLGNRTEGYAGSGETRASAIDIVCGRNGSNSSPVQSVDPLPFGDAARIYISEKTDCDSNFGLCGGTVGKSTAVSAIVLKADGIRIVGREGVKIISGIGQKGESNALGGAPTKRGIDLIAGNTDEGPHDMQPLVKGDRLKKCLETMISDIESVAARINTFMFLQLKFNAQVMAHPHLSPYFAAPPTPSPTLPAAAQAFAVKTVGKEMPNLLKIKINLKGHLQTEFLSANGPQYILSEHNYTN